MNIKLTLKKHVIQALINNGIKHYHNILVQNTYQKKPWNYQINGIIKIAKATNKNSYDLANEIALKISTYDMYKVVRVSQPGFINIFINEKWMIKQLEKKIRSSRLDVKYVKSKNVIIDYSSPNVAKEMHVGHLRSTIIGDAIARIMEFLGHNVTRINHIGDWGMQFGMIIAYLEKNEKTLKTIKKMNFNQTYQLAKELYENNTTFQKKTEEYTIKLQSEDKYCKKIWKTLVDITIKKNEKIYKKLNVTLHNKHIVGESFYKKMLPNIVHDLTDKKIAIEHNGNIIVFSNSFKNRNGEPMGIILQKTNGIFLYAATDLACLKYRYKILKADQIIYYVDTRQHQYLMQVIEIGIRAGYIPTHLKVEHHMFGMILSKNNRPFKTRSGKNIKLSYLLDEAIKKARIIAQQKNPTISFNKLNILANKIGIGAIKYFDLSKNRTSNYIFNWEDILSFNGNTAPYIQYAYTRILSIFKKLNVSILNLKGNIQLIEPCEKKLGLKLLQFEETIIEVSEKGMPHILCSYLYELSVIFSKFYETCSILLTKDIEIRSSRLTLAFLTAKTLKKGLNIIGISTISYM
ncbi:MAG: arginine--tRNA ligase [Buchnera aphidicola (Schlechtendalia peitan)]